MIDSRTATLRFTVETNVGSHKIARMVALAGKRIGLDVAHDHDGAWFDRMNVIVATGSSDKVRAYRRYLDRIEESVR